MITQYDENVLERLGLQVSGPQKPGKYQYWKIRGMERTDISIEETLKKLIEFNDILRTPDARAASEKED